MTREEAIAAAVYACNVLAWNCEAALREQGNHIPPADQLKLLQEFRAMSEAATVLETLAHPGGTIIQGFTR